MPLSSDALRRRTLLVILDGFGVSPGKENNATYLAYTPNLDDYFSYFPSTVLQASGNAVGLPKGQMGSSEVGHLTLGSGSVMRQSLVQINEAIQDNSLIENESLVLACKKAHKNNRPLHLLGLVSDGGVHSHLRHLLALIDLASRYGVEPQVHVITDGRDVSPRSAMHFINLLKTPLQQAGGRIASVCGRSYAMDRNQNWARTQAAWKLLTKGSGLDADDAESAISNAYIGGQTDEFIEPTWIAGGKKIACGDSVIFFNFRSDRARQLAMALGKVNFPGFERGDYHTAAITTLTQYSKDCSFPVAFRTARPATTLAEEISQAGLKQLHCAETEKQALVTYFFNGGREKPFAGEDWEITPSPDVSSYDQAPAMSAEAVANNVITAIDKDNYDFVVANFANGDMVGHTGKKEAIIESIEVLDLHVGRAVDAAIDAGYSVVVTADHGNCEEMSDLSNGNVLVQHTSNPVPCLVMDPMVMHLASDMGLSSIAPTVLELMGLPVPPSMTGKSLLSEERKAERLVA